MIRDGENGLLADFFRPEEFAAKFRDDMAKFAKVVKDAQIPLQD